MVDLNYFFKTSSLKQPFSARIAKNPRVPPEFDGAFRALVPKSIGKGSTMTPMIFLTVFKDDILINTL